VTETAIKAIASQGLELTSWSFLALSAIAVAVHRLAPVTGLKIAAGITFNIAFLLLLGLRAREFAFLAVFLTVSYVAALAARTRRKSLPALTFPLVIIAFWAIMFLAKDPALAGALNPFTVAGLKIIGLSYFCFRAIATIMDAPELESFDVWTYVHYMTYFPAIIAGPIERYDRFSEDLAKPAPIDLDIVLACGRRIAMGFVKKYVIADNLAPWGIFAFGSEAANYPVWFVWLGVLLQLFIIFLDFSGYCDIMIGIARAQGFRFQENFDKPYFAPNLQEFWNRWHMSLTFFVRDYVFTPISKWIAWNLPKRLHTRMMMAGYFLTMLIIALWHQITWGFLLFGLMHGAGLVALQLKRKHLDPTLTDGSWQAAISTPPLPVAVAITYVFFAISTMLWFFSPAVSWRILSRLVGLG
jgi:alginate O-acetyltransferase complex protein AlgI